MVSATKSMKDIASTNIDERACILQNYSPSQKDANDELEETPVMFYDYAFDEHQSTKGQTTAKNKDQWDSLSLGRIFNSDGELNYSNFPDMRPCEYPAPERALFVRVIDFPELKYSWAKGFLETIKAQMKPERHNPPPDRKELGERTMEILAKLIPQAPDSARPLNNFKSGISFNALKEPLGSGSFTDEAFLALMVYMPYFDISTVPDNKTESLSLSEYRLQERGESLTKLSSGRDQAKDVLVHQVWFMVFNNEMIAMFRSAEDKHSDPIKIESRPRPLFPDQHRVGIFHALVQMISNIFTSSRKRSFVFFRKAVARQEFDVRRRMDGTALPSSDGAVIQALDSLIANITTLKSIVQSQIEILEDLRDIYENTNRTPAKRNCRNKNVVKIPVLQRAIEEIPVALITIDGVVEEREKYHEKLDVLLERVGRSKKYLGRIIKLEALQYVIDTQTKQLLGATVTQTENLLRGTSGQTESLLEGTDTQTRQLLGATVTQTDELLRATMTQTQAISEQTRALSQTGDHQAKAAQLATEKQTAELEKQRQVVTAFTILTTLFLPLGFCASYFGAMNNDGFLNTRARHRQFWKWSASATIIVIFITCLYIGNSYIEAGKAKLKVKYLARKEAENAHVLQQITSAIPQPQGSPALSQQGPPTPLLSPPTQSHGFSPTSQTRLSPISPRGPGWRYSQPPTPRHTPSPVQYLPGQYPTQQYATQQYPAQQYPAQQYATSPQSGGGGSGSGSGSGGHTQNGGDY